MNEPHIGWEGNPIKEAIAEQEEYLKRCRSCQDQTGLPHDWTRFQTHEAGVSFEGCNRCLVTRTREDYAIFKASGGGRRGRHGPDGG